MTLIIIIIIIFKSQIHPDLFGILFYLLTRNFLLIFEREKKKFEN